jgi:hypothetical protein
MDLNVKLQGLKHKIAKDHGCFCKNTGLRQFSGINKLFFYRKRHGPGLRYRGPGSQMRRMGPRDLIKCGSSIHISIGPDLIDEGVS